MTTEHQALAHQRRESDRRADRAGNAVTTPKVDGPTSGKIALQRLAGNRAVAAMQAGVVQRKGPGQGGTKPAKPQAIASPFNSYVDLLNGFQELAAAAINRGGAGLDTVRFGRDLSPSHRYLLARVRAVLIQAQEQDKDARVQAAAAWPALAAKLQVAVSEARRLQLPGEPLANVIDQIAMVSRKYVHSRRGKADPEVETPEDYADTVMGMQELLAVFSMMGESGQGLIREEVPNRKDAAVSLAILEVNARQRAALAAVKFGSHLNRRHAKVLDTLRKALILARTEAPGSAYRAVALWRSIQGEMQHVLRRAPNYVDGDIGPAIRAFGATGEVLARHYAAVHQDNLRVALTKERGKEQVKTDKMMGEAMGPSVAKAMKEARVLDDFQHALTVLEQHLTPSPAHAGEWVLTSGGTVIRVRGDQVESLRGTAGAALKRFMADITTVMVDAWQTYDSIKRGNSSFKLRVLGGWGGATDPGDQEDVKNSVMRVRDTIVYPLVDQGKYVEAFRMIISQKGVVERHAREVGDYDADLDRGYNRLCTAMKVIQVALVSLVPVAGEAALASGAAVWAVGGTAVAAGGGGAAYGETWRQLASGEDLDPSKIGEAAYSGGVIGVGAVAPVATRGLGKVLAAGGEGTTLVAANALASGTVGAVQSKLGGGDAIEGFAGGAVGSLAGSATKSLGAVAQQPLIQGGVGAGTAALTGGDPLAGAVGGIVGAATVTPARGGGGTTPTSVPSAGKTIPGVGIPARPPAPPPAAPGASETLPGVGIPSPKSTTAPAPTATRPSVHERFDVSDVAPEPAPPTAGPRLGGGGVGGGTEKPPEAPSTAVGDDTTVTRPAPHDENAVADIGDEIAEPPAPTPAKSPNAPSTAVGDDTTVTRPAPHDENAAADIGDEIAEPPAPTPAKSPNAPKPKPDVHGRFDVSDTPEPRPRPQPQPAVAPPPIKFTKETASEQAAAAQAAAESVASARRDIAKVMDRAGTRSSRASDVVVKRSREATRRLDDDATTHARRAREAAEKAVTAAKAGDHATERLEAKVAQYHANQARAAAQEATRLALAAKIDGVNPTGSMDNCGHVIEAVEARLSGTNPDAQARPGGNLYLKSKPRQDGVRYEESLGDQYDASFDASSESQISQDLAARGEGAQGAVFADRLRPDGTPKTSDTTSRSSARTDSTSTSRPDR